MKRVVWLILSVILMVLLGIAGVGFTQTGLHWLLKAVPHVQVKAVQGNLAQGFSVGEVQWTGQNADGVSQSVLVKRLQVVPDWAALWANTLHIQALSAYEIEVQWPSEQNSPPVVLPEALVPPWNVTLQQVRVDTLRVNEHEVTRIQGQVQLQNRQLEITQLQWSFASSDFQADTRLALKHPYIIHGQVHAKREQAPLHLEGRLDLRGTLEQLNVSLDATAQQARQAQQVRVDAVLLPFTPQLLERMAVSTDQFNPKDWLEAAPHGRLNIQATVQPSNNLKVLHGHLNVRNAEPLSVRQGGIPIESLSMGVHADVLHQQLEHAQMNVEHLRFAQGRQGAGEAKATLEWTASNQKAEVSSWVQNLLSGDARLQLTFAKINPAIYVRNAANQARPALQGELNGDVRIQGNPKRMHDVFVQADILGNTVQATGAYGHEGDELQVQANLPKLRELGQLLQRNLEGTVAIQANVLSQTWGLSGQGNLKVRGLHLEQALAVKSLDAQFNVGNQPSAPWVAQLNASGVGLPSEHAEAWLDTLNASLKGNQQQHTVQVDAQSDLHPFSRRRALKGALTLTGGLVNEGGKHHHDWIWQGDLQALRMEGLWAPMRSLVLQQSARVRLGQKTVELGAFSLKGEDDTLIQNQTLRVAGADVHIEGQAPALPVPRLSTLLDTPLSIEPKGLVIGAHWRYHASPTALVGQLNVSHVSGGLQVLEDLQMDVPLQDLQATLDFTRQAATLNLNINAKDFGLVSANLKLPIAQNHTTKAWGLAGQQPMQGAIGASFSKLNWLGPMINGGVRTQGSGQIAVAISGTLNAPDVQGRLFGMGLEVFQLDQGMRLEDGQVIVDFTTDQATIHTFDFTVRNRLSPRKHQDELLPLLNGPGKLSAHGAWNLSGLNGSLALQLNRAVIVQRPDRWILASSNLQIQQPSEPGKPIIVRGDLNMHGAYIETPEKSAPSLGDDVVIKGNVTNTTNAMPLDVQLQANAGPLFFLSAHGLHTRLEGGLRLAMQDGGSNSNVVRKAGRRVSAMGTIKTEDGTYRAYGQDLSIEQGIINFQGALDNPGLHVRAVRKGGAIEAGVEVTGSAQRPKVTLISEPAVSDAEKLSWMLIGRGTNASDREQTLLLTAATALFGSDDDSPTRKIAKRLGIDDFGLSTGSLTAADPRAVGSKVALAPGSDVSANATGADDPLLSQRIITLGKRLSDTLVINFDQSVTTAANILKLNYQHSRPLSVIVRTGADNAIDVLYQLSFD